MKVTINRRYTGKTCVIGKFNVLDDEEKILFECFSLEEDKEGLESGKDLRIPEGNYNLKRHSPSRFENTLRSITKKDDDTMINVYNDDVPSSRAILIHWGNTDKYTQGCILLGLTKDNNNESVGQSRQACKEFYDLMHGKNLEDIKLEITNELA
ncbi:hypothetical protein BBZ02_07160 [Campylobacter jejuni]|uniref:DUF5675 family protein n=1 Tax=Campylobacter jejuni TaxID=197 RepID=UPI00069C105F|nr:DUF5675 family protein [Campylobacter jejuni]EAI5365535.1 hypothetical protein [Campylobacter jejuni]EAI5424913.1 hypothetical protein [Campylobacter jejuni]EAI7366384.1 hypothetical protein [Campylobacter jejuni]EAJ0727125.1 hypothetical protein [Campylobacter jejuni]EAJ7772981.1 hypothetical protein [Campylobacter jejuni]